MSSSDLEKFFEVDVLDIVSSSRRKIGGKRVLVNIPDAPLDNVSFLTKTSVHKWKYVVQRRVSHERDMRKEFVGCHEIMDLLKGTRLIKTLNEIDPCCYNLAREFILNISLECNKEGSHE